MTATSFSIVCFILAIIILFAGWVKNAGTGWNAYTILGWCLIATGFGIVIIGNV